MSRVHRVVLHHMHLLVQEWILLDVIAIVVEGHRGTREGPKRLNLLLWGHPVGSLILILLLFDG